MNEPLPRAVAEGLLKGMFDVFDAMLSLSFSYSLEDPVPLDVPALEAIMRRAPVMLCAHTQTGGGVALFLTTGNAAWMAARAMGNQPVDKSALDADDIAVLREVAKSCLGGGLTYLMETLKRNVVPLESVSVETLESSSAAEALASFTGDVVGSQFEFSSNGLQGQGAIVFSMNLANNDESPQGHVKAADISKEEVQDILSGLEEGEEPVEKPAAVGESARRELPPNLDMVLDIRMVATARLGRIEMPIGEILSLGPGSIIQVGRLVDEPVELLVNDKLIARGDVVVVDEKFGLRITEIISTKERIESLH
ncbi:MAG TPA: flagellar motor switch protein FliN [Candidatus Hydrogenedentes bacterium]|nr:flagellar motor switch protein FliN [Candidatus Hydrogenedentota bacterium]HOV73384.1 flagellar motor switch protein FliN [Candidatus Hydrogenedentota bacterium]